MDTALLPRPDLVLTRDEAEEITKRLKGCLINWHNFADTITELARKAYHGQAFKAMGYDTWRDYARAEFGDLELPRSVAAEINAGLINQGQMSSRSAAAISGTSDKTAARDAGATAESSAVDDTDEPVTRRGADGKQRPARKPKPAPRPAREPEPCPVEPEPPRALPGPTPAWAEPDDAEAAYEKVAYEIAKLNHLWDRWQFKLAIIRDGVLGDNAAINVGAELAALHVELTLATSQVQHILQQTGHDNLYVPFELEFDAEGEPTARFEHIAACEVSA